jgi:putative membrane protein
VVVALGASYLHAERRIRPLVAPGKPSATPRQFGLYFGALVLLGGSSSWPFHDLAEQVFFSLHMVEHMLVALVIPPLMLMGTPRWMAEYLLDSQRVLTAVRHLCRPLPVFFLFHLSLAGLHWRPIVETMVASSLFHFLAHFWLFAVAILMWVLVVSPTPLIPRLNPPLRMLYLFLHSIIPTVPASFLTFSRTPLYPSYVDSATEFGVSSVTDLQISGLIMKLGGGMILWGAIVVIWFRWIAAERKWDSIERDLRRSSTSGGGS